MPAISIIMNVQNGAATLREALQSALAQTFTDWELIVWDDCSTDDSASIARSFADNRIQYVGAVEKVSLARARQSAIQLARGEWLAFLDQDDIWMPRKLEMQLTAAGPSSVGLIYGRTVAFTSGGSQRDHDYLHEFGPLPEGDIQTELVGRGCFIAMSSALVRRSAALAAGAIPQFVRVTPDYFLYLSVCEKYEARAVQEVVCYYRMHAASMTGRVRRQLFEETKLLVERWRDAVPDDVYDRRMRGICTALAVEEMQSPATFLAGAVRLMKSGSIPWLASRPLVHMWRAMRRRIRTPYWKRVRSSNGG